MFDFIRKLLIDNVLLPLSNQELLIVTNFYPWKSFTVCNIKQILQALPELILSRLSRRLEFLFGSFHLLSMAYIFSMQPAPLFLIEISALFQTPATFSTVVKVQMWNCSALLLREILKKKKQNFVKGRFAFHIVHIVFDKVHFVTSAKSRITMLSLSHSYYSKNIWTETNPINGRKKITKPIPKYKNL